MSLRDPKPGGFDLYGNQAPEWYLEAPCRGLEDLMFDPKQEEEAKVLCSGCPFKDPCLTIARNNREEFGVWGGKTPQERTAWQT